MSTIEQDFVLTIQRLDLSPGNLLLHTHIADCNHMTKYLNAEFAQKYFCQRSNGHTRRRFPGRGALQNVSRIGEIIFQRSGKVRMSRPWRCHTLVLSRIAFTDGQSLLPILPISVFELHGNGRTDRHAMMYAGKNMGRISFDLHTAAAAVALLTPPQFAVR